MTLHAATLDTPTRQALAADPSACAWVSANAGTGKTYVLVRRVLRCLLSGAAPESMLCLTYTKAAAAEMENRLLQELSRWAVMGRDALARDLEELTGRAPGEADIDTARSLFARVLDARGGLNFMTIHSFCNRVLKRFPLEGGLSPGFRVLSEAEETALIAEAIEAVLAEALARDADLRADLETLAPYVDENGFSRLAHAMIAKREALRAAIRHYGDDDDQADRKARFAGVCEALAAALGAPRGETAASLAARQIALCGADLLARAAALSGSSKPTDRNTAERLARAQRLEGEPRRLALLEAFLTQEGKARNDSHFITKEARNAHPALAAELMAARDAFAALEEHLRAQLTLDASLALMRLGDAVISRYEAAKHAANAADHDDLILKTLDLLRRTGAEWVLYRIDSALRHVLIDEAQDTNAEQWEIIRALTAEFFSGAGAVEESRTVFAVGDEKQSIFGFQGAAPEQFALTGRVFRAGAKAAGIAWNEVPLVESFRTTEPILNAVDMVFASLPGFAASEPVRHEIRRKGEAGLVELWPPEIPVETSAEDAWQPPDSANADASPAQRVAERIAATIRGWLDTGERLASLGRPIAPGDILILLRKREPFLKTVIRALQERGIPVAGADRLRLAEHIAILDLVALGEALLQPMDDLSLACALKSPLFGFGEDDLFAAARERAGSLWAALEERARERPAFRDAVDRLHRWRALARGSGPFSLYSRILDQDGLRPRFLARLGVEAGDAIAEFLDLALAYEAAHPPSLQGFLHWFKQSGAEIKRDLDRSSGEVRVMTVHGAKGLEAEIVFLPDTCSRRTDRGSSVLMIGPDDRSPGAPPIPVHAIPVAKTLPAVEAARKAASRREAEEYLRLLYVAMTRARDRLYIAGFEGKHPDNECWYRLIERALIPHATPHETEPGRRVFRLECPQTAPPKDAPQQKAAATLATDLPAWATQPAPRQAVPTLLRPSLDGAASLGFPASLRRAEDGFAGASVHQALLRGRFMHRLLEVLPSVPSNGRRAAAETIAAAEALGLPREEAAILTDRALEIVSDERFRPLFGPGTLAEVPVHALIEPFDDRAAPILVSGQIDRLIVRDHGILIVDYKSDAVVPETADAIPEPYLAQLAAYALAMEKVCPGKALTAAILWLSAPLLMPAPAELIAAARDRLVRRAADPLDAKHSPA